MVIIHVHGQPDQLRCNQCNLAFEFELNGPRLHVTHWPMILEELDGITEDWQTVSELRTLAQKVTGTPVLPRPVAPTQMPVPAPSPIAVPAPVAGPSSNAQPAPVPNQPARVHVSDEFIVRIKKLRDLGNTPQQIQRILAGEGKTPEEIQAGFEVTDILLKQDQARQQKKLWRSLGVTAVIILLCISTLAVLGNMLTREDEDKPVAVANAQNTMVPQVVEALHLSTPRVEYAANPPSAASALTGCPKTAAQAALVFGGDVANWTTPPGSNGWIMIDPAKGNSIYIPENMTAAYMELGESMTLSEVFGPAQMENVYYIAISCP